MQKTIKYILITWTLLTAGLASGQTNSLCQFPEGTLTKKGVMVYDKSSGTSERYDFELLVRKGADPAGSVTVYDSVLKNDGSLDIARREHHYFTLSGCTPSSPIFNVTGPDVTGYLKVHNVNLTLGDVTVSGAIHTYEEGIAGWTQWASEKFWEAFGSEGTVEVDIRQLPIRLKK